MKYDELKNIYKSYFSIGNIGVDINSKFALISLICYVTDKLKSKKPDVTHYQVIKKILGNGKYNIPDEFVIGLAIMCEDFSYGCSSFPTFGIPDKEMPNKIKEILENYLPF